MLNMVIWWALDAFAAYLAVVEPDQLVNLFISTLVVYLVASAWATIRGASRYGALGNKIILTVGLLLWLPFAILSLQLAIN